MITAPAMSRWVAGPASVTKVHKPTINGRQFGGDQQRPQECVPGTNEGEDQHRHNRGFTDGQNDLNEEAHMPGSIEAGRIPKIIGDFDKKLAQEENAKGVGHKRHGQGWQLVQPGTFLPGRGMNLDRGPSGSWE